MSYLLVGKRKFVGWDGYFKMSLSIGCDRVVADGRRCEYDLSRFYHV